MDFAKCVICDSRNSFRKKIKCPNGSGKFCKNCINCEMRFIIIRWWNIIHPMIIGIIFTSFIIIIFNDIFDRYLFNNQFMWHIHLLYSLI